MRTRAERAFGALLLGLTAACGAVNEPDRVLTVRVSASHDTIAVGTEVTLEAHALDGVYLVPGVPFEWREAESRRQLGTGPAIRAAFPAAGPVRIQVTANDSGRVLGRAIHEVTVVPADPHTADSIRVTPTRVYAARDTVTLVAFVSAPHHEISVTWWSDRIGQLGSGHAIHWAPQDSATGDHRITLRITDRFGAHWDASVVVRSVSTERWRWSWQHHDYAGKSIAPVGIGSSGTLALADDGRVYVGFLTAELLAFTPQGTLDWILPLSSSVWDHSGGLTIAPDGRVFAMNFRGDGYAVRPDGTVLWQTAVLGHDPHGRFAVSPDGALYVGGASRRDGPVHPWGSYLVRLDPATGTDLWRIHRDVVYDGGPVVLPDGRLFILHGDFPVSAHQRVHPDGIIADEDTLEARGHYMAAADAGGAVFVARGGTMWKVDDGGIVYSHDFPFRPGEPVIDAEGTAYMSGGGVARAIEADGTVRWEFHLDESMWISRLALLADGSVLITEGRVLYRVDRAAGLALDSTEFAHPIATGLAVGPDGGLYVVLEDGRVVHLDGWAPLDDTAPWPIWRRDNRRTASVPR